ncbi:MAG: hypothetical protein NTZ11_10795 [Gammaproteobacteria bacterium]|nr:hypothetical protein [Gammaproteobacteria bacterium]
MSRDLVKAGELPPVIAEFLGDMNLPVVAGQFVNISDLPRLAEDFRRSGSAELGIRLWRGANLLALSQQRKGEFKAFLTEIGMNHRTAFEHMQLVNVLGQLPSTERVRTCALVDFSKLRELTTWAPDDLDAFLSGKPVYGLTFEAVQEMNVREFKEAERAARQAADPAVKEIAAKNIELEKTLRLMRQEARARQAMLDESDLPMYAREARQEAAIHSEQISLCIETLEDVASRTLLRDVNDPEALRWQPIAANTFLHALTAVLQRGFALTEQVRARFGEAITAQPLADHVLEPHELKSLSMARDQVLAMHKASVKARDDERANTTPGRRGNKRGPRNKRNEG